MVVSGSGGAVTLCNDGITRHVVLAGGLAFKIPRLTYGWQKFLLGLLCNMQEATWGRSALDGLCPVVFALPGGWLTVMRRARVMTEAEFRAFDVVAFCDRPDYVIPAEYKHDSFGWLDGRVVAVDYGS